MTTHRYDVRCSWSGSTGVGYEAYSRAHDATSDGVPTVRLSADQAFRGDDRHWNPEQLVVLAASSCQLLSFLAVCARARIDVVSYEDDATGEMDDGARPVSLTRIVLRPLITVRSNVTTERIRHLVDVAHHECFIANSLRTPLAIEPTIAVARA